MCTILIALMMTLATQVGAKECPAKFLKQGAVVFDLVLICVTKDVSHEKLKHAAHVTAQWLDNNQDGEIDEKRLRPFLVENRPVLLMSADGFNFLQFGAIEHGLSDRIGQDLSAAETAPRRGRDASQEEIHHLIFTASWVHAFSSAFSEIPEDRSNLFLAWRLAEKKDFYHYDDPTCDAECKVVEFFYLATAAYLGSQIDVAHDELFLKTRTALKQKLPEIIKLIENVDYEYPRYIWPDGEYSFSKNIKFP